MKKAIKIDVANQTVEMVEVDDSLESLYREIGCTCFQTIAFADNKMDYIFVDEEGLFKEDVAGFTFGEYNQPIVGNGLILGTDIESGESKDAVTPIEQIRDRVIWKTVAEILEWRRLVGFAR